MWLFTFIETTVKQNSEFCTVKYNQYQDAKLLNITSKTGICWDCLTPESDHICFKVYCNLVLERQSSVRALEIYVYYFTIMMKKI